ncbi:MAG: apolipoprotein N-acyltransferase [Planctomycetota bacterium]
MSFPASAKNPKSRPLGPESNPVSPDASGPGLPSWWNRFLGRLNQHRTLCFAFILAYFLGQAPLQWPLFGWIACLIFCQLVTRQDIYSRRDWIWAWIAASLMWLLLLQGIRLAFWPLAAGWIALSLYLAVYFPLAIGLASHLHRTWRFPLPWACASAWTTTEWTRAHFLTGFAGCELVHSQTPWPVVLTLAAQLGGYGVGFMMMLTCGWIWDRFFCRQPAVLKPGLIESWPSRWVMRITLVGIWFWLIGSFVSLRVRDANLASLQPIKPLGKFLLIQDHMPTMFEATPESIQQGWMQYEVTTRKAAKEIVDPESIDAVVWPESVFAGGAPYLDWDGAIKIPEDLEIDREQFQIMTTRLKEYQQSKLSRLRGAFPKGLPNLLVGTDVLKIHDGNLSRFNAALWIERGDSQVDYYAKNHLVMFGEYIPIVSWFPSILKSIGLGEIDAGTEPTSWRLKSGRRISPNVCFEDFVPHLMRSHIKRLNDSGQAPDLLINISNDAWFRGSSILDHHFNSAIVTAVENRTPILIAANTGITAWVDGDGRVVKRLPKMEPGWLLAEPIPDGRMGFWVRWGDLPARIVSSICFALWSWSLVRRWRQRSSPILPSA